MTSLSFSKVRCEMEMVAMGCVKEDGWRRFKCISWLRPFSREEVLFIWTTRHKVQKMISCFHFPKWPVPAEDSSGSWWEVSLCPPARSLKRCWWWWALESPSAGCSHTWRLAQWAEQTLWVYLGCRPRAGGNRLAAWDTPLLQAAGAACTGSDPPR